MTGMTFEYMKKHFPLTEAEKVDILDQWMRCEYVKNTLKKNGIGIDFFARYFGSKVIDYAAGIVSGENKHGNCPVIGVMLVFFEKKRIPLGDLFMICVNLKNALIGYALEKNILDHFLLHEICTLVDFNFAGVIREYLILYYDSALGWDVCSLEPLLASCEQEKKTGRESAPLSGELRESAGPQISPQSNRNRISAMDYVKEVEPDHDILEELAEIEQEAMGSLGLTESISPGAKAEVVDLFHQYAKMLERLIDFEELSFALRVLIDLLEKTDVAGLKEETTYIIIYIKAVISDLSAWRISVFAEQNAEDIHYLDKTLLSSIAQLQILLSPEENAEVDDVEFF